MLQSTLNSRIAVGTRGASLPPSPRAFGSPSFGADPISIVDAAVRTALAELHAATRPAQRASAPVFADRLFSLRHAETLSPGTRVVRIAPGTVVTPLARDLMKRQGVVIQLAGLAEFGVSARGEWAFAIDSDLGYLHALRRSLLEDAGRWTELGPALDDLTGWIQAGEGRGALLVTTDGALAVWRACQAPGVRAAVAAEPADVHRASRSMGANLIVVEPTGKSLSWIKQLATAFRQAGAPRFAERPSWLKETEG
ncbi:MAG: hypothetical protein P4L85_29215 [Paludisphaera borealis]|uniref:hypothetical protein n=1 Tax=Paludisphaera borealis TaxID=1387353 RepID=UPI00284A2D9E|nr:hypothetical protein [Paludisphaera borealis]MDR3623449.1 hypothetical protein [Paludisphaera borealis]